MLHDLSELLGSYSHGWNSIVDWMRRGEDLLRDDLCHALGDTDATTIIKLLIPIMKFAAAIPSLAATACSLQLFALRATGLSNHFAGY
jgi:hypothetical protein